MILNVQGSVPLQPEAEPLPPLQPLKVEPVSGTAVSVTAVL